MEMKDKLNLFCGLIMLVGLVTFLISVIVCIFSLTWFSLKFAVLGCFVYIFFGSFVKD